jgi:hypothetical protein
MTAKCSALQRRVQGLDRVDLGDHHQPAEPAGPFGQAAPAVAETGDHDRLAGQQGVGGPDDPVQRGLPGAVPVVEHVLGVGVVHRHHREAQRPLARHLVQPDHAGRRLLAPALDRPEQVGPVDVQGVDQIAPVVQHEVGPGLQRLVDVPVVPLPVGTGTGEHLRPVLLNERRRGVVLRGQRIGRRQRHARPARLERPDEVGGLGGDMHARRDPNPVQRPLSGEPLPDLPQHRHRPVSPPDPLDPLIRKRNIRNVAHLLPFVCVALGVRRWGAFLSFDCVALGVRRWGAFLQRATRRSLHRSGSPRGSLRDQVLAFARTWLRTRSQRLGSSTAEEDG